MYSLSRALFYAEPAVGALAIIKVDSVALHREGVFRAHLDAAAATDAAHLTDFSHHLTLLAGVAGDKGPCLPGNEDNYALRARLSADAAAGALVAVNPGGIPAHPGQGAEGTCVNTVPKT